MPTVVPDHIPLEKKLNHDEIEVGADKKDGSQSIPPLGTLREERKFWFQRGKAYDPNVIATQVLK